MSRRSRSAPPGHGARRPESQVRACRIDPDDPALPVAGQGSLAGVRPSRNAPRRAWVLVLVHLLIGAHALHFLLAGKTLSPVEPSESMYTLELGQLNAGFLLFVATIVATLLFGRFFCGWGCHIVALQDLCGYLMKRAGIRPRPFRSRLLLWLPMLLAVYMFVWPTVERLIFEPSRTFPGFSNHLMTDGFWETFPGPLWAVMTLGICGFGAVYLLGAKGFCTYGCPYGAIFGVADRLAVGRILVNDACEQCGHCTATCTSNVLVHDEVRRFGQVVDPGCMKCMDCVSVCPKNALRFGFARPAVAVTAKSGPAGNARYPLGWVTEIALLLVAVVASWVYRGLYDGPPLLLAVAIGGITAYVVLIVIRLVGQPTVRLQDRILKLSGRVTKSGWVVATVSMAWIAFTVHGGVVQGHRDLGRRHLERTEATRADVLSGAFRNRSYSEAHHRAASRLLHHFEIADRWGLVGVPEVKLGLAWGQLLAGNVAAADRTLIEAIELLPERGDLYQDRIELLLALGDVRGAIAVYRDKVDAVPAIASDHFRLAAMLVAVAEFPSAVEQYRACLALEPDLAQARFNLGGLLRRMGDAGAAVEQLEQARAGVPGDAATRIELALALAEIGEYGRAIVELREAIVLDPASPESRLHLPGLIEEWTQLGRGAGETQKPTASGSTSGRGE